MQRRPAAAWTWRPWAKLLFSVVLLGLVAWKVPVRQAGHDLISLSSFGVLGAVGLTFVSQGMAAWRWKRVLARSGVRQPWSSLLRDLLVAATYNMLLPASIGGDVVRAMRCASRLPQPALAWSSVLFERLLGVFALGLLTVPGLAMVPGLPPRLAWASGAVMLMAASFVALAHGPFRLAARILSKRAPRAAGIGRAVADQFEGPLASWPCRIETLAWSVAYQASALGILAVVVLDWSHPEWVVAILAGVPLALVVSLLPVSLAGLGVRESMFVLLLGQLGVPHTRALSLAMIWLLSSLLLALVGALVLLVESRQSVE